MQLCLHSPNPKMAQQSFAKHLISDSSLEQMKMMGWGGLIQKLFSEMLLAIECCLFLRCNGNGKCHTCYGDELTWGVADGWKGK